MAINLWTGHGTWQGWTMRKYYQDCKFGESVLVDPDGNVYGPADILKLRDVYESLKLALENRKEKE